MGVQEEFFCRQHALSLRCDSPAAPAS